MPYKKENHFYSYLTNTQKYLEDYTKIALLLQQLRKETTGDAFS